MYEVKIIDKQKPIILLRWQGIISKQEVLSANEELEKAFREVGNLAYFLVDVSELKIFAPDTKEAIIDQQKRFLPYMKAIASVMNKALVTKQLAETRKEAGNEKETPFTSFDEAFAYLKSL